MLAVLFLHRMSTKRRLALKKRATSTEKLQQGLESKFCRTCLGTEHLLPIFCSEGTAEKRSHDLKLATGLDIRANDGLSQKICSQCTDAINSSLHLRHVSRRAERALLRMAAGSSPKVKKKYRLQKDSKSSIKSEVEVEVVPVEVDFSYDDYGAGDFQNDYDYGDIGASASMIKKEGVLLRKARPARAPAPPPPPPPPPRGALYSCGQCHKDFLMKATYKAHMRFHTNFCVCEACGKRCRNNNQLQEHKRARHGLGRIHKCAYCEYSSATKEALTIHERRHTGERPYVCDHCGATFHRRSNLVQHIAIHLPEKNWQCDMCPKRLKSKKFLQIHKHNAHTGKRYGYLCAVCAHRFEKPNKVRAHTRRVHGVPDDQQAPITRVLL